MPGSDANGSGVAHPVGEDGAGTNDVGGGAEVGEGLATPPPGTGIPGGSQPPL